MLALLLEEAFPAGCVVEGVDFSAAEEDCPSGTLPPFLQRYYEIAHAQDKERTDLLESDRRHLGLDNRTLSKQDVSDKGLEQKKVAG